MFDWQTDETVDWEEPPQVQPPPRPPAPRRRWLRPLLLTFTILVVSTLLVYRLLSQRVNNAAEDVEADVLTSHQFVSETAVQKDWDLLVTFVSGRDSGWSAGQRQVVEQGLFYNRPAFGLAWQPQTITNTPITVTLSPDLRSAELLAQQGYTIQIGNGLTETVVLQQTAVYRQGANSWLLAPPLTAYWGGTQFSQGHYLYTSYPTRDETISQQLARDLDTKLIELCTRFPDLRCPDNLQVSLELSADPASLVTAQERQNSLSGGVAGRLSLRLPAPTLLGLPLDEAGYQALFRGYATLVVTAVISEQTNWVCCNHIVFYQAIVDEQLQQLGIQPPPNLNPIYTFLAEDPFRLEEFQTTWQMADLNAATEALWPAPVIQFLRQTARISPVAMQRELMQTSNSGYNAWLMQLLGPAYATPEEVERAWARFLHQNNPANQTPPPINLPTQDLQLLCLPVGEGHANLYRYQLTTQQLNQETILERPDGFMIGLPDDSGVVVGDRLTPGDTASMFFWHNQEKKALRWDTENNLRVALPMMSDPAGKLVLFNTVTESAVPAGSLPIESCLQGEECTLRLYAGFPTWSPDGSRVIFTVGSETPGDEGRSPGMLLLSDNDGSSTQFVDNGSSPFWLNNSEFGYVATDEATGVPQVYVTDINGREPSVLFTAQDLPLERSDISNQQIPLRIDYVAPHPNNPAQLFVGTKLVLPGGIGYLFTYNWQDKTTSLLFEWDGEPTLARRGYRFSPNGRFFLLTTYREFSDAWHLYLYDTQLGTTQTVPLRGIYRLPLHWYLDWSADGNWLSLVENGSIHLLAPAYQYQTTLMFDPICQTAVWVNREN